MQVPRLAPLTDDEMSPDQRDLVKSYRRGDSLFNVFRVGVRNVDLFRAFKPFGLYTMLRSELPPRLRELAILRVAIINRSDYEWGHHVRIARELGVTDDEITRIRQGADAEGWSELERVVLSAVAQLMTSADLDEPTFERLMTELGERCLTDLIYTVGNYATVSTALKVFRVPLEPGIEPIDPQA